MVKSCTEEKSKVTNESLPIISQEATKSVAINDKTHPKPSTETALSTFNTAAPNPAQEKVKQKINTENNILVGLYQKRDFVQLSQGDCKEIRSRETTPRKCKAYLKQKEAAHEQQK